MGVAVDEYPVIVGGLHESRGEVHVLAEDGEVAALGIPEGAAEGRPGGDPDARAQPELTDLRLDLERGVDRPPRVVLVAEGRNAEGADEGRPLLVHRDLVQPAGVPGDATLGRHRDLVTALERTGWGVGAAA